MKNIEEYLKDIAKAVLEPLSTFKSYTGIYPSRIGNIFKTNSAWLEMCKLDVITYVKDDLVITMHTGVKASVKTTYALYYTCEVDGASASWFVNYNS